MFERIKWPGWFAIAVLFVGIVIGIDQVWKSMTPHASKTLNHKETITEESAYPGLNLKTYTGETNTYTLSTSKPSTKSDEINKHLHDWIRQQENDFLSEVKANKQTLSKNGFRAHLNIQLETKRLTNKIYSLVFTSYQITGGANGQNLTKSFTIDLNKNKILTISDVFELSENAIKTIQNSVTKQLHENNEIAPYLFDDMIKEALKDPANWKWSINNKNLTIYFDEYEIAAGAAGTIKVEIPIEKIKSYLSKDFAKQLNVDIPEKEKKDDSEKEPTTDKIKLDPNGKYVALTFDDGPNPNVTPSILKTLKEHDAKATFFMLGSQVEYYPALAKKVTEAGHEIGNHTANHQDLTVLDMEQIKQEIRNASKEIKKATSQSPTLLRPPYGATNEMVKKVAKEEDAPIILWSVDSLDWKSLDADAVNEEVLTNVAPGAIVLMHDIHPSTADALPALLTSLEEKGYEFITVSQLLSLQNKEGIGPFYGHVK